MPTVIPPFASFRSTVRGSSLVILSLCLSACGDSSVGPTRVVGAALGHIYAGNAFTCGIVEDGTALCWGLNSRGQLGRSFAGIYTFVPQVISEDLRFRELSTKAAGRHVCGLATSGDAYCWGENRFGQLGNGTTDVQFGPQLVSGGLKFASITAGWRFSCWVTTDEAAYCWGRGEWGQLGDGLATRSAVPTAVAGGHKFRKLSVGSNNLVCGVTTAGSILMLGSRPERGSRRAEQ
jgi:alpha-tubulin suppressor-like RCC1 family protein